MMKRLLAVALLCALALCTAVPVFAQYIAPHLQLEPMTFRTSYVSGGVAAYYDSASFYQANVGLIRSDTTTAFNTTKIAKGSGVATDTTLVALALYPVAIGTGEDSITVIVQGSVDNLSWFTTRAEAYALKGATGQFLMTYGPTMAAGGAFYPLIRAIWKTAGGMASTPSYRGLWLYNSAKAYE